MAKARALRMLEDGAVEIWLRPRVEHEIVEDADDVQRLLIVLRSSHHRLITIGRKRLPDPRERERFWGFVDVVSSDRGAIDAALREQRYRTITRGVRQLPAARRIASGTYAIAAHDGHTHLAWRLDDIDLDWRAEFNVTRETNLIVTVFNADPSAWGEDPQRELFRDQIHIDVRTPFPPELQQQFGDRRFVQLDSTEWLDYEGAELVFIAVDEAFDWRSLPRRRARV